MKTLMVSWEYPPVVIGGLGRHVHHLSTAHQAVLVETFYNGGSLAELARELGIPPGTARSRLHYAQQALRQHLQENYAIAC